MNSLTRSSRRSRISAALLLAPPRRVGVRLCAQQQPPVPSSNINMVSGTSFPDGDPYLQRQNEPNAAVSTRNPLHLLAGANDYRTVDLPGPFDPVRGFKMAADAWVGLFKSVDGGKNWKSTLLPGFPQDVSPEAASRRRLKGREGATDPILRPAPTACSISPASRSTAAAAAELDLRRALHGPEQPRGRRSVRLRRHPPGRQRPGHALPRQGGARHRHSPHCGDVHHHQPPVRRQTGIPDRALRGPFRPVPSTSPMRRSPARARPSSRSS